MARKLSLYEVEDGMILAEDVVDEVTGNVLMPKDSVLDFASKNRLENYHVHSVLIVDTNDEEKDSILMNAVLTESYNAIEEELVGIYEDLKSGKEIYFSEDDNKFEILSREAAEENDILSQLYLLKNKDDYTYNHGMGVGVLAAKLGGWLNLSANDIKKLSIAGTFHDIGKVKIDDSIVFKRGPLTDEEYEEIKKHPQHSYDIVKEYSDYDQDILDAIHHHHERLDGSGYPHGLKGDEISMFARIIGVCDVYHAIISNRVYKPKDSPFKAARILRESSFQHLDPYVVRVFLDNISRFYVGNKVLLSDGRKGTIVYIDQVDRDAPVVKVGEEFIDFKVRRDIKILEITI
ncbi:MAG: HD-GYP domain-containing protein [Tissierellia bacterium]|nr:HD-GYP domain-containing protein [Tissierellia bacterium]